MSEKDEEKRDLCKSKWIRQRNEVEKNRIKEDGTLAGNPNNTRVKYTILCIQSNKIISFCASLKLILFKAYCQKQQQQKNNVLIQWNAWTWAIKRGASFLGQMKIGVFWGALGTGREIEGGGNERKMPVVPTQLFSQSRSKTALDWPHRGKLEMCPAFVCCC